MNISIADDISEIIPHAALGVISYLVEVEKSSGELIDHFRQTVDEIAQKYELQEIAAIPNIQATREAYKALGKSPSQYRNAAEAMLRRVVKGNGLYEINNIVDLQNLISIRSGYTIGSYDKAKLTGDITLQKTEAEMRYVGIGDREVNVGNMPVLFDEQGPFGNPTADSKRAMITEGKRNVISILYSFHPDREQLQKWLDEYELALNRLTNAEHVETKIIDGKMG